MKLIEGVILVYQIGYKLYSLVDHPTLTHPMSFIKSICWKMVIWDFFGKTLNTYLVQMHSPFPFSIILTYLCIFKTTTIQFQIKKSSRPFQTYIIETSKQNHIILCNEILKGVEFQCFKIFGELFFKVMAQNTFTQIARMVPINFRVSNQ